MRLSRALKDKLPQCNERHDKVILQLDNARPHVAKVVKTYLETLKWKVLPHPLYFPDLALSDYHLFRSMAHGLADQHFRSYEEVKNWIGSWIASKDNQFFQRGIPSNFGKKRRKQSCTPISSNFRLPKLNIPVFSGKFEDWINFKDSFLTSVHSQTSLGNIKKFQYLEGLLSDEPSSLIKHIPLSNESYEEAWGKLIDRYDKKKQIVYALIKTFLDQKGISQVNMTNLRNLVDTSDEVLRGLKALGTEATNRDHWFIQILMQKLDTEMKRLVS
ncbi:mariner Mos1 transposase [Trichonephila clavipes]|nr:mariner Mos1 transposase [Trichonephila clavipes]